MNILELLGAMHSAFVCICVGPVNQRGAFGHFPHPMTIIGDGSVQCPRLITLLPTHLVRVPRLVSVAGHNRLEIFLSSSDVVKYEPVGPGERLVEGNRSSLRLRVVSIVVGIPLIGLLKAAVHRIL